MIGVTLLKPPASHQHELKQLLCNLRNTHMHTNKELSPDNLFLGVGSDEAIDAIIRCFCVPAKDKILTCPPTYGMYSVSAQVNDVNILEVPQSQENGFTIQPDAINEALAAHPETKVVYLCSPGNPTGSLVAKDLVREVLENPTWNGVVVVDEAYIDFASGTLSVPPWVSDDISLAQWVTEWPNLIVMQTLSKAFGLAGVRLGAAFTSVDIAALLNSAKAPYNISNPTSVLASAALQKDHLAVMKQNRTRIIEQRERLLRELPSIPGMGTMIGGTNANFLLWEILDKPREEGGEPSNDTAVSVYQSLAESKGVVVRFRGKEYGCTGCLRITVGTEHEVDQLLHELTTVLGDLYRHRSATNGTNGHGHSETLEQEANDVIA